MPKVLQFYLDDSGTRHPDRHPGKRAAHGYDWFALGGVLADEAGELEARRLHNEFCHAWKITHPLHSVEIRNRSLNFLWLEKLSRQDQNKFYEELYQLMKLSPVVGLACVIDRSGYNKRYAELYNANKWLLCKTAFSVAVERAAKMAISNGSKLRVMPERCNKREDSIIKSYYDDMRINGMPFSTNASGIYQPLTVEQLKDTLYEFHPKRKSSPMIQLADLYLWPICMGGYHASNRPYARLKEDGKLIECLVPEAEWPTRATKYSCFENVARKP